jgi:hypothetical protein
MKDRAGKKEGWRSFYNKKFCASKAVNLVAAYMHITMKIIQAYLLF